VTTQLRRRDYTELLGVEVVAVASQQEPKAEGREPSEAVSWDSSASVSVSVRVRNSFDTDTGSGFETRAFTTFEVLLDML